MSRAVDPSAVPELQSQGDVLGALSVKFKAEHPEYVKAVFASYIKRKQARGKKPEQISKKLDLVERALVAQSSQYPDFAAQIAQARATFSLPTTDSNLPSAAHGNGKPAFRDSTITSTTLDSSP